MFFGCMSKIKFPSLSSPGKPGPPHGRYNAGTSFTAWAASQPSILMRAQTKVSAGPRPRRSRSSNPRRNGLQDVKTAIAPVRDWLRTRWDYVGEVDRLLGIGKNVTGITWPDSV